MSIDEGARRKGRPRAGSENEIGRGVSEYCLETLVSRGNHLLLQCVGESAAWRTIQHNTTLELTD